MTIEIKMPNCGPGVQLGNLVRWLIKEGDSVKPGDVIAEVESDKVTMEVEASHAGIVTRILAQAGAEQLNVGDVIALVEPSSLNQPNAPAPERGRHIEDSEMQPQHPHRLRASPLVRRLAREHEIELSAISGSGPAGRIVRRDIAGLVANATAIPQVETLAAAFTPVDAPPPQIPHETFELSTMRRVIARRMTESKSTIPQFRATIDVNLDAFLEARKHINLPREQSVSLTDLFIKAIAAALYVVKDAHVQFAGEKLYKYQRCDVAVAVAVAGGITTPVIEDASNKEILAIAAEMRQFVMRARSGNLQTDALRSGTVTLSNLGMYGIKQFDAIINPPQALIVAVGAAEARVIADRGNCKVATMSSVTGSFDHRVVDGVVAAQFMSALKNQVEQPHEILRNVPQAGE